MIEYPVLVTPRQAASRCKELQIGVSETMIRRLVNEKRIPYVRSGVKVMLNWARLLDYLSKGESG